MGTKLFKPDSLGVANEGIHKHIFGIAITDLLGTIIIGCLIGHYITNSTIGTIFTCIILLLLGEIAHLYYNVPTTFTKYITGSSSRDSDIKEDKTY